MATKADIVKIVSADTGIDRATVKSILEGSLQVIMDMAKLGEKVEFRGFGTFTPKLRKSRYARDIKNNKAITIPEKTVVKFSASKFFEEQLQGN